MPRRRPAWIRSLEAKVASPRAFFGACAGLYWLVFVGGLVATLVAPHSTHGGAGLLHAFLFAAAFTLVAWRSPQAADLCATCGKPHRLDLEFCSACGIQTPPDRRSIPSVPSKS